jgi:hypothetical protein
MVSGFKYLELLKKKQGFRRKKHELKEAPVLCEISGST